MKSERSYTIKREFTADAPNEKWFTDVTEFHYYIGLEKHKVYLSAILDLYDRRIVSYIIRDSNNNALVFDTVDEAIQTNRMLIHCFIVTAAFNIRTEHFTVNSRMLELCRVC